MDSNKRPTRFSSRKVANLVNAGKLTEIDWDVVWELFRHRFLSTDQLHRILFPGRSNDAVWYRTRKLYKLAIIDRLKLPRERMIAEGLEPSRVYSLGPGGKTWVKRTFEERHESRGMRSLKSGQAAVSHPLLYHDLVQNEYNLRLYEEAMGRGYRAEWLGEWEATQSFVWDGRRRLFRPDGALTIESGERVMHAYVEMDMGGRAHRRTTKKVPMYERYYRSREWEMLFDTFPVVFTITSTEERRRRLMKSMERTQRERGLSWLYASRERLSESLIGPVWTTGQGKSVTIFKEKA